MATKYRPKPDTPAAFYDHYRSALVVLGTSECGLSRTDAQNVAHEVLMASLGNKNRIPDMHAWLTATMRSAAQTYKETHVTRR